MYYGWTNSMIAASDADNLEAWIVDENNTAHNKQAMYLLFDHGYPNMPSVRGVFNAQGCSPMVDAAKTVEWARRSSGGLSGFNTDGRLAAMLGRRFEELLVFAVVFEERQRSYDIFSRTFGVGLPCEKAGASHQSQRSVGQPPQAHIEALIRERNALDLVLVGMARELLDRYNVTATDSAKPLPACRIVAKPHKGKRGGKLVMEHSKLLPEAAGADADALPAGHVGVKLRGNISGRNRPRNILPPEVAGADALSAGIRLFKRLEVER